MQAALHATNNNGIKVEDDLQRDEDPSRPFLDQGIRPGQEKQRDAVAHSGSHGRRKAPDQAEETPTDGPFLFVVVEVKVMSSEAILDSHVDQRSVHYSKDLFGMSAGGYRCARRHRRRTSATTINQSSQYKRRVVLHFAAILAPMTRIEMASKA